MSKTELYIRMEKKKVSGKETKDIRKRTVRITTIIPVKLNYSWVKIFNRLKKRGII